MNPFTTRRYRRIGEGILSTWAPDSDPLPPCPGELKHRVPDQVFVRGRPEAFELLRELPARGLAIVGTRRPQPRSLRFLREELEALRAHRLVVISGLALGIDAAAHEIALVLGLPTIAILGSPLDEIYPTQNQALARRILESGGLVVSEYPPGERVQPHFFLMRNRFIATWSRATWIVEAGIRSGALNTAQWAHDHDREAFATPGYPGDPALAGCNKLLASRHPSGVPKARPFLEAGSLDVIWSELKPSARRSSQQLGLGLSAPPYNEVMHDSDTGQLKKEVARRTLQSGGASVENLLDWAIARRWDPPRFFEALRAGLDSRALGDRDGTVYDPAATSGQS